MFKNSKWIWKANNGVEINDYGYFFKEVNIDSEIIKGEISISAHNHFKLYVNDKLISGYVTPAPSVANKTKLYLTYNITKHLKQGKNLIGIYVLYLGGDGQNYVNFYPGLITSGYIETKTQIFALNSNESWKYIKKIPYISNQPYQSKRRVTQVECFDNRIELNYGQAVNVVLSKINDFNVNLKLQEIPEGSTYEEITPKLIKNENNIHVFDCGKIITGFVRFRLKGIPNQEIKIRYSEDLQDGFVKHNVTNEFTNYYYDAYIMRGLDREEHQADFTYRAFRYFQIENYPLQISENQVVALHASTKIIPVGHIKSESFPLINHLLEMTINTHINNTMGMLVDCPHREQAQYLGDSFFQMHTLLYNFKNAKNVLYKVLDDFSDSQFTDGTFPFVTPTNFVKEFKIQIPEYDLYYILILAELYKIDKDKDKLYKYYQTAQKIIAFYLNRITEIGLVKKTNRWHISDWPYPTVNQDGDYLTVHNLLVLISLEKMSHFSQVLNKEDIYYLDYIKLKDNIRKHLINDGLLIDSYHYNYHHPGVNALGIEAGVFTEKELPKAQQFITTEYRTSIILSYFILKAALKYNLIDFALEYIFNEYYTWGKMIKKNSKTLWEGFMDIESHSHAWGSYPIRLLQEYMMGINKISAYEIKIAPKFHDKINDLDVKVLIDDEIFNIKYVKEGNKVIFSYYIPDVYSAFIEINNNKYCLDNKGSIEIIL